MTEITNITDFKLAKLMKSKAEKLRLLSLDLENIIEKLNKKCIGPNDISLLVLLDGVSNCAEYIKLDAVEEAKKELSELIEVLGKG